MKHKAQRTQLVVKRDNNDAFLNQTLWVVGSTTVTVNHGAAVDPYHDRVVAILAWRVNIQVETVFVNAWLTKTTWDLWAGATEFCCFEFAC